MNDLLRARLAAQYGALAVADAYSCGYTKLSLSRVVSAGELIRVRTGAFVDAQLHAEATPEGRHALVALAIARSFGGRHAVSHHSAVAALELPLLSDDLDVTHLSRRRPVTNARHGICAFIVTSRPGWNRRCARPSPSGGSSV